MHSFLASIWNFVNRQLLAGIPAAIQGERNFRGEQSDIKKWLNENEAAPTGINGDAVISHTGREQDRRKSLEEKARNNLSVVSVCSTLAFTGLTFLTGQAVAVGMRTRMALLTVFFFTVVYFVAGVIGALRALQVTERWTINLDDEGQAAEKLRGIRLVYLDLNTLETNIKANWTAVSFACLRNAVISLLVFASTVLLLQLNHPTKSTSATLPQATSPASLRTVPATVPKVLVNDISRPNCCCRRPEQKVPDAVGKLKKITPPDKQ
jgi:hypothetical protein